MATWLKKVFAKNHKKKNCFCWPCTGLSTTTKPYLSTEKSNFKITWRTQCWFWKGVGMAAQAQEGQQQQTRLNPKRWGEGKKICIRRELNPGLPRGRRKSCHWTTDALLACFYLLVEASVISLASHLNCGVHTLVIRFPWVLHPWNQAQLHHKIISDFRSLRISAFINWHQLH